jgi:hypothetical protein
MPKGRSRRVDSDVLRAPKKIREEVKPVLSKGDLIEDAFGTHPALADREGVGAGK